MIMPVVQLLGVGLWSDVAPDWPSAQRQLRGLALPVATEPAPRPPAADILPPTERRRATTGTRLAIAVATEALTEAGLDGAVIPSVFTSSASNPQIIHELCDAMSSGDYAISPTRFHNSVHNSPAGYFSIGMGNRRASTSIGAGDESAAAGLLETAAQTLSLDEPVLFVSFDFGYPYPLLERRDVRGQWAVAMVLAPPGFAGPVVATLQLEWVAEPPAVATPFATPALAEASTHNPTGRLLPLLRALANDDTAPVSLRMPAGGYLSITSRRRDLARPAIEGSAAGGAVDASR